MRTADDLAAAIRRTATRCADPSNAARLHALADEAKHIKCTGPTVRHY